tara:strand:- start:669 stop:1862 length:1194 start_codon:yes stop_codon:yes gene_type:complete
MANSPNNGLITETNEQYYGGQQAYIHSSGNNTVQTYTWTADTPLITNVTGVSDTNFKVLVNNVAQPISNGGINPGYIFLTSTTIQIQINVEDAAGVSTGIQNGDIVVIELVDSAKWANYGSYQYISIKDIINNFIIAYVGESKIIPQAKRSDIMFHAKRGLQEFSYDTLRSIKSQELTIPSSLAVIIPQDYVNYVKLSWIDEAGVKRIIYPTDLTINPVENPLQDNTPEGVPIQGNLGANLEGSSMTEERWKRFNPVFNPAQAGNNWYQYWNRGLLGQRYGLEPEISQSNGWFTINHLEGKFSFSSNLANKLIVIEYISDGLAYNEDSQVPKMAEEALYMHIAYSILAGRIGVQEYIVQRFKKDRRAALRNAKIRLSNIKLDEFVQIMRGKSKWIKY